MWHLLHIIVFLCLSLDSLAKAVRLADELKNVRFVREAVQQGCGQALIAKDLYPISKTEIGGDDHSHSLVQSGTELKDQLSANGREGDEAQLVQDDQLVLERRGQELG